jgi:hypothetical protein
MSWGRGVDNNQMTALDMDRIRNQPLLTRAPFTPFLARAAILWIAMAASQAAPAQAPSLEVKTAPPAAQGRAKNTRKSTSPPPARPSAGPGTAAQKTGGSAAPSGAPVAAGEKGQPGAEPAAAEEKGLVAGIFDFVVAYAVWILVALGAGLAVVIYLLLRSPGEESAAAPGESREAVRPPPREEEGPRRVLVHPAAGPSAKGSAGSEDREYALVVNEEDLKMPPLPEEGGHGRTARRKVDGSAIQDLLARDSYDDAYRQYLQRIEADGESEFAPEIEKRMSDHFLRFGDLEKAGRILEHHVATHSGEQISPETYFNLGYIHFKGKTLNKSRRYFRLFVERQSDPRLADRARKILKRLERVQNLN